MDEGVEMSDRWRCLCTPKAVVACLLDRGGQVGMHACYRRGSILFGVICLFIGVDSPCPQRLSISYVGCWLARFFGHQITLSSNKRTCNIIVVECRLNVTCLCTVDTLSPTIHRPTVMQGWKRCPWNACLHNPFLTVHLRNASAFAD